MYHIDMAEYTIEDLPQPAPEEMPGLHVWRVPVVLGEHSFMASFLHDFLDNWLKQNDGPHGTPFLIFKELFGEDRFDHIFTPEQEQMAHKAWCNKIITMRNAFKIIATGDSSDRTPEVQKMVDDGLLEFATWFECLWD